MIILSWNINGLCPLHSAQRFLPVFWYNSDIVRAGSEIHGNIEGSAHCPVSPKTEISHESAGPRLSRKGVSGYANLFRRSAIIASSNRITG